MLEWIMIVGDAGTHWYIKGKESIRNFPFIVKWNDIVNTWSTAYKYPYEAHIKGETRRFKRLEDAQTAIENSITPADLASPN